MWHVAPEHRTYLVERRQYAEPGPRRPVLQIVYDGTVLVAERGLPVGADPVPELQSGYQGVQEGLLLRYLTQRHEPRDETGLDAPMGRHPRQTLHVPADEVHHYGLGGIIEIVARCEISRSDGAGLVVHQHPTEDAAIRARTAAAGHGGDGVHRDAQLRERPEMEFHTVIPAESPDDIDARRTIALYPLVYGDRMDLDAVDPIEYG